MKDVSHGFMIILNDRGLHCRPSMEIVKCAHHFKSEIFLNYKKNKVNAKSLLSVLMLAACKGAKIKIEAIGIDAEEAVSSLIDLAEQSFKISY